MPSFGKCGNEGQDGEARHRRNGGNDADPCGIDADRAQPDREERQVRADQSEQRAVKYGHPNGELARSHGDL